LLIRFNIESNNAIDSLPAC